MKQPSGCTFYDFFLQTCTLSQLDKCRHMYVNLVPKNELIHVSQLCSCAFAVLFVSMSMLPGNT